MKKLLRFLGVGVVLSLLPCLTISPSVSAGGNVSYGMDTFLNPKADTSPDISCVNWYAASNFDWVIIPYWTKGVSGNTSAILKAAGKDVILRTWPHNNGSMSSIHPTWTDVYNSMLVNGGNGSFYNYSLDRIITQINEQGASNIYAATIGEEEPMEGCSFNLSLVNISQYIFVHNQLYSDIKAVFPTLRVFAAVDIDLFTDGEMASLSYDGLVNDMFAFEMPTMSAWLSRMESLGKNESYPFVYATSNFSEGGAGLHGLDEITPAHVGLTNQLAISLGVEHLGWWAYDESPYPLSSDEILFNTWPSCSDPNNYNCPQNYKDAILNILNGISFDSHIINGSDDALQHGDESLFSSIDDNWYVKSDNTPSDALGSGFRFQNVSIPIGANITSAYIAVYSHLASVKMNGTVYAHNVTNSQEFVTNPHVYNISFRPTTTASMWWNGSLRTVANWSTSPDIYTVIQEMSNLGGRPATLPVTILVLGLIDTYYSGDAGGSSFEQDLNISPILHIEYQTTPQAQTKTSTVINGTAATVNGRIYSDGGLTTQGRFFYGTSATYTSNSSLAGSMLMADTFNTTITGLTKGQHYHWLASSTNSLGTGNGSDTTFITYPDEPNTVAVIAINSTALTVNFNQGIGAAVTAFTRKAGSYPANPADGTIVYLGAGVTFDDTGLTASTTYYYRGWSLASSGGLTATSLTYGQGNGATPATPVGDAGTNLLQVILALAVGLLTLIIILQQMQDAGTKGMMIAITLSAIAGAVAFIVVKLVVGAL